MWLFFLIITSIFKVKFIMKREKIIERGGKYLGVRYMEKKLSIREKMALQLSQNKSFYVEKTRESTKSYEQYLSSNKKEDIDRFIYYKK